MVSNDNNMESEQELVPTTARNLPQYPDVIQPVAREGSKEKTPKRTPSHHIIVSNNKRNHNQVMADQNGHHIITQSRPFKRAIASGIPSVNKITNYYPQGTRRPYAKVASSPVPKHSTTPREFQPLGIIPTYHTYKLNTANTSSKDNWKHPPINWQPQIERRNPQPEGTILPDPRTRQAKPYDTKNITRHKVNTKYKMRTNGPHIVQPSETLLALENAQALITHRDIEGFPLHWQRNGKLMLSHEGVPCCQYCGIPSHNRSVCRKKRQDVRKGISRPVHPLRGHFNVKLAEKEQTPIQYYQSTRINHENYLSRVCTCNHKPQKTSGEYNDYRNDTFTRGSTPSLATNPLELMDMPSEIIEKILSYIPFKQRIRSQRINHRIRDLVTGSYTLWNNISIKNSYLNTAIMKKIVKARPVLLDIPGCIWKPTPYEEIEIESELNYHEPRLKYLGLQGFEGTTSIVATIIVMSKHLKTLDLSEASFALLNCVLHKIDRTNKITDMDMSIMDRPHLRRRCNAGHTTTMNEMYTRIQQNTIPDLVTKCTRLTSLNLCGSGLSQDAIVVICHLITPTLTSINLAGEFIINEHISALINRCPKMKYINLAETAISHEMLCIIADGWKHSLVDLSLPDRYVRDFQLYRNLGTTKGKIEFKMLIDSIQNLERLHVGHYRFEETDVMYRAKSTKLLVEMFPTLSINVNPFGKLGTSKSNPDNKFRNTIKPRSWVRRL